MNNMNTISNLFVNEDEGHDEDLRHDGEEGGYEPGDEKMRDGLEY